MSRSRFTTTHLLILTVAIFAVGVVIDMAIVGPKMSRIKALAMDRQNLQNQMSDIALRVSHEGDLAAVLGLENLKVLLSEPEEDVVAFLGRTIDESGLTRLDLNTTDQKKNQNLTITSFSVRASGDYAQMLDFVRNLEGSSRLAAIESFKLESSITGRSLEGRFNLSIYDPGMTP